MKLIPLTQRLFAQVDDWNYEWLNQWKWYAQKDKKTFYAARGIWDNGHIKTIRMHREILNTPDNVLVDHKDHNGLNNQEFNIRNVTHSQNQMNKIGRGTSRYLGVTYQHGKYIKAKIRVDGKLIHLGTFLNDELAALAYNEAAIKYHGEFANLNIIH